MWQASSCPLGMIAGIVIYGSIGCAVSTRLTACHDLVKRKHKFATQDDWQELAKRHVKPSDDLTRFNRRRQWRETDASLPAIRPGGSAPRGLHTGVLFALAT